MILNFPTFDNLEHFSQIQNKKIIFCYRTTSVSIGTFSELPNDFSNSSEWKICPEAYQRCTLQELLCSLLKINAFLFTNKIPNEEKIALNIRTSDSCK